MSWALRWLSRHRLVAVVLALLFFILSAALHDVGNDLAYRIKGERSMESWNRGIVILCAAIALAIGIGLWMRIRVHPFRWDIVVSGAVTVGLAVAAFKTLIIINSEAVHFVQYAGLALLLYPVVGRFGSTVLLATLLGVVDEAHQYFVLHHPWQPYFDMNDILLNLIGASAGAVLAHALSDARRFRPAPGEPFLREVVRSPVMLSAAGVLLTCGLLLSIGLMRVGPDGPGRVIHLRRTAPPTTFWIDDGWGKIHHQVTPAEGVALMVLLVGAYTLLDYRVHVRMRADTPADAPLAVTPSVPTTG